MLRKAPYNKVKSVAKRNRTGGVILEKKQRMVN